MATGNIAVRYIVQDVKDEGHDTEVTLPRPAVATDSPNGTENASVFAGVPDVSLNRVVLRFKAGTTNPFVNKGQVVATFAVG